MLQIDLTPGEQILKIVRRHWFAILGPIVSFGIMAVLPPALFIVIYGFAPNLPWTTIAPLLFFLYGLWLLFGWNILFYWWTNFYLDVWIITTLRIFTIDQKVLFSREISSFTLDKIHDLTIDVSGIIATFLKFGRLSIETAAEKKVFLFKTAKDPENIKRIINDAQNDYQSFIN